MYTAKFKYKRNFSGKSFGEINCKTIKDVRFYLKSAIKDGSIDKDSISVYQHSVDVTGWVMEKV